MYVSQERLLKGASSPWSDVQLDCYYFDEKDSMTAARGRLGSNVLLRVMIHAADKAVRCLFGTKHHLFSQKTIELMIIIWYNNYK